MKLRTVHLNSTDVGYTPVLGSTSGDANFDKRITTDYVGNKTYENDKLKRILVDGGYIEYDMYHFHMTDHLGNSYVVAKQNGGVAQRNHYYPFGMEFAENTAQNAQPYKYNGKELDKMHGLNMYDYSARYYESGIGRFTTVDPLAEKKRWLTPYHYCSNNPINRVDLDGRDDYKLLGNGKIEKKSNVKYLTGADKLIGRDGNYIFVPGGLFKNMKSKEFGKNKTAHYLQIDGDFLAESLFKFVSQNTYVEWSRTAFSKGVVSGNLIGTTHLEDREYFQPYIVKLLMDRGWNIDRASHSHPGGYIPSGYGKDDDDGDKAFYEYISTRAPFSNGTTDVYNPDNDTYRNYDYMYREPVKKPIDGRFPQPTNWMLPLRIDWDRPDKY